MKAMNGLEMLFCSSGELALWRDGQGGWAIILKHREVILQRLEAFCCPGRGDEEMQAHEPSALSSFRDSSINTSVPLKESILSLSLNCIGTMRPVPLAA